MATIEYGKYIELRNEQDAQGNLVKVKAIMIHPDIDGRMRGVCEKITYDQEGKIIHSTYDKFINKKIIFTGTDYLLEVVA